MNDATKILREKRDALLLQAKELAIEMRRKSAAADAKRRNELRYATAVLGGYVVHQAEPKQRAGLIAAAVMSEKKKRAREALQLLAESAGGAV